MGRNTATWVLLAVVSLAFVPGGCAEDSTDTSDDGSDETAVDQQTLVSRGFEVAPDGDAVRLGASGASLRLRSSLPVELGVFKKEGERLARSNAEGFGELWDAVGAGVRQSWYFPEDPSPGADLVVSIEVENGRALARTREGIIIGSEETGPFAYSDAVWIGADGERTPVGAAYLDSSIELRVPASLLENTEFPAWLDPTISAPLDPFVPAPTLMNSLAVFQPAISCNATTCRIGFDLGAPSGLRDYERRGIITNTDAVVQTPISSLVAMTTDVTSTAESRHSIANIGGTFLVVWRSGTSTVYAQRFTAAGAPLDATSFVVGTTSNASIGGPSVAANNTNFMVTWGTSNGSLPGGLDGRLIDVNGQFVGPAITILAPGSTGLLSSPEAASDGTGFAIGFYSGNTSTRVVTTGPGMVLTANTFLGSSDSDSRAVAWDGTSYIVGWTNAGTARIRRVSSTGTTLAATSDLGTASGIRLACRTGDCLAILRSGGNLLGQALLTGVPAGGPIVITTGGINDITTDGTDYQLLWDNSYLRMSPVTLQGVLEVPGGSPVEYLGNSLGSGLLTSTPTGNLAMAASGSSCVTAFISAEGVAGPGATLAGAAGSCSSDLLEEGSNNFVHLDRPNGRVLDAAASSPTAPVNVTAGSTHDAYWNGGDFMLVNSDSATQFALRRFSVAGQLFGGTVFIPGSQPRGTGTPVGGLVTAIVGGNQTVRAVDPTGTVTSPVTTLGASPVAADVAWGVANGGVTWASTASVFFQRLDQAATPLDAFAATVAANQTAPRIAWDGSGYVVAYRSATTNAIRARRMRADGVADGADFSLPIPPSTNFGVVRVPGAASGGRAAVYSTGSSQELHATRLILAYIDADAIDGTPCTGNASCQSGLCVDGLCCATACGGGATDCQACSVAAGGQQNGQCTALVNPGATVCRAAVGVCDVAETCVAASTTCPADTFAPSSVECRASADICDVAESCTGAGGACPVNGFVAGGTQCRASADDCDAAESCTGLAAACPADAAAPSGTVCRAANGDCDVAETCNGSATACPVNGFVAASTECRAQDGDCGSAESCDGASADCPADEVAAAGTSCRDANGDCDAEDFCDGVTSECEDEGQPEDTPCGDAPMGDCDLQDTCSGGPGNTNECNDWVLNTSQTCRPAEGECDVEEKCDLNYDCPEDELASDGTECGDDGTCSAGECSDPSAGGGGAGPGSGGGGTSVGGSSNDGGSPSDGGSSASGDGDGGTDNPAGEDGCGCRLAAPQTPFSGWLGLGALALVMMRRRRSGEGFRS